MKIAFVSFLYLASDVAAFTTSPRTLRLITRRSLSTASFAATDGENRTAASTLLDEKAQTPSYTAIHYKDVFRGDKPASSWQLAYASFCRNFFTIGDQFKIEIGLQDKEDALAPPNALQVSLSNEEVIETERIRIESGGKVDAHPVSRALYDVGCLFLDKLFDDDRPIQRFWFLETIARIPYFSYVSMLHLYESFGWWRAVELRKVHNAEEYNELHHLLIMESLGGNLLWSDRFLGYHVALIYYWALNVVFLGSPRVAYEFMELLEAHAVDTYGTFVRKNHKRLKQLPAPRVAQAYYKTDVYMFDDFQQRPPGSRRPPCDTLLDVFENICQDEAEHVKTMQACQEYAMNGKPVLSPHTEYKDEADLHQNRQLWNEWSDQVNSNRSE